MTSKSSVTRNAPNVGDKRRAEQSRQKKAAFGRDLNLEDFSRQGGAWEYDPDYRAVFPGGTQPPPHRRDRTHGRRPCRNLPAGRQGHRPLPDPAAGRGSAAITEAASRHDWVNDLLWGLVAVDADKYTAAAELELDNGYFIRALKGAKIAQPVESCLYLRTDRFAQHVHNLVVVEEGASLHIITAAPPTPGSFPAFTSGSRNSMCARAASSLSP